MNKKKRNTILLICAIILLLFLRMNSIIIITSPIIHKLTLVLAYICFIILFIRIFFIKSLVLKILLGLILGFIVLIGSIIILFTCFEIEDLIANKDKDIGFECLSTIKYNNKEIKTYRTNGGATTAFGIIVREEKRIIPGLIYSNKLFDRYRLDTVLVELKDNKTLYIMDRNHKTIKEINLDK